MGCRVYFIRGLDLVKIGTSVAVEDRLRDIQATSPALLTLMGTIPGDVQEERRLHAHFAHLRAHGEWFRAEPELLDYIAETQTPEGQGRRPGGEFDVMQLRRLAGWPAANVTFRWLRGLPVLERHRLRLEGAAAEMGIPLPTSRAPLLGIPVEAAP